MSMIIAFRYKPNHLFVIRESQDSGVSGHTDGFVSAEHRTKTLRQGYSYKAWTLNHHRVYFRQLGP